MYRVRGITFNNKHSITEYDLFVEELNISPPVKNKITEAVPFMNGSYDFSLLYGENTFSDRTLTYSFRLVEENQKELNNLKLLVNNCLLPQPHPM